ncbi:hypothetical protein LTR66_012063 [Elasticomyces elasticus]|nr:hypothetical protein LTR66_012063 [Elasticomyces elasticus]
MAAVVPSSGISLHGASNVGTHGLEHTTASRTAMLVSLTESLVGKLRQCADAQKKIQVVTGKDPVLRFGDHTLKLAVAPESFRHELYSSRQSGSSDDLTFNALIKHHIDARQIVKEATQETRGTDAALTALKNSLASIAQAKESRQSTITTEILPVPNSKKASTKLQPFRKNPALLGAHANKSLSASPSLSASATPFHGPVPTSVPAATSASQAMKKVLIHYLAIKPAPESTIRKATGISKDKCALYLPRVGKKTEDGNWQLKDMAYKQLNVWDFNYKDQDDRQAVIDNAVRAYDRMRLSKDDNLWQLLLPKEERGKGKSLSRLHLRPNLVAASKSFTGSSPIPATGDEVADKKAGGAKGTPTVGAQKAKANGSAAKRLLSKDPKKARAALEAKENKKREREAAASDRENKKTKSAPAKKPTGKFKSAEVVEESASDDDDDAVVGRAGSNDKTKLKSKQQPVASKDGVEGMNKAGRAAREEHALSSSAEGKPKKPVKQTVKSAVTAKTATSSDVARGTLSKGAPLPKTRPAVHRVAEGTPNIGAKKPDNSFASAATNAVRKQQATPASSPRQTPARPHSNSLGVGPDSRSKYQHSPPKIGFKPAVPSPLGATRPRNTSDPDEDSKPGKIVATPSPPENTTKKAGMEKRATGDKPASKAAAPKKRTLEESQDNPEQRPRKTPRTTPSDVTAKLPPTPKDAGDSDAGLKRKANDLDSLIHDHGAPSKHRKTDSLSSPPQSGSQPSQSARTSPTESDGTTTTTTAAGSPPPPQHNLSFDQGLRLAQEFLKIFPVYEELYDRMARQDRKEQTWEDYRRLMRMHERVEELRGLIFEVPEGEEEGV